MAALVATLVTIGLMTKNSELVVMRACGISLYRTAAPLLLFAVVASAVLFGLQERVMAYSNREADRLNRAHPRAAAGELRRARPALDGRRRTATSITTSSSTRRATSSASSPSITSIRRAGICGR